jgi:hypothetical protein
MGLYNAFLTFFALSTSLNGFLFLLFPDLAEQFYWVDKHISTEIESASVRAIGAICLSLAIFAFHVRGSCSKTKNHGFFEISLVAFGVCLGWFRVYKGEDAFTMGFTWLYILAYPLGGIFGTLENLKKSPAKSHLSSFQRLLCLLWAVFSLVNGILYAFFPDIVYENFLTDPIAGATPHHEVTLRWFGMHALLNAGFCLDVNRPEAIRNSLISWTFATAMIQFLHPAVQPNSSALPFIAMSAISALLFSVGGADTAKKSR